MKLKLPQIISTFLLVILFASFNNYFSQDLSVSTNIVSRYVWRGLAMGTTAPCLQPTVELGIGSFTVGLWGSHTFKNSTDFEIDLYAGYSLELPESGSLKFAVTDYTNPNNGINLDNFNNYNNEGGPGAHSVEMNATYSGPEYFPISLSFNMYLHNVENNPIYVELGYSTSIMDVDLNPFIGATPGDKAEITYPDGSTENNSYYGTEKFSIINIGLTATKTFNITEGYSIPVFGSIMHNPNAKNTFYVFGVTFQIL
jgi:uncharacterized protein (TIGR02001 family)